MKKIGLLLIPFGLFFAALTLVVSCVQLKSNSNPNDPTSSSYKAPVSNAVLRGWKIDPTGGISGTPALRCINVPTGGKMVISFSNCATTAAGAFATIDENVKTSGTSGGLEYRIFISNYLASSLEVSLTNQPAENSTFQYYSRPNTTGGATIGRDLYWRIEVRNMSDQDGSNSIWFDNLGITGGLSPSDVPVTFSSGGFNDSRLTGDKEQ